MPDSSSFSGRRRLLAASLALTPLAATPLALTACAAGRPKPEGHHPLPAGLREGEQHAWQLPESSGAYGRMQMAIPRGYAASAQPWPLLVFLHGAGERGLEVDDVKRGGPPMLVDRGIELPMIVCSPQADPGTRWQPQRLHALVAALLGQFAVDPRRVLATGLSLGGSGVWRWACEFPDDLAAIAPICGYVDPGEVHAMLGVPVRAYHGELDPFVPLARQRACVAELQRLGGKAELTVYQGVGHDAWTRTYEDPALWAWLQAQARP